MTKKININQYDGVLSGNLKVCNYKLSFIVRTNYVNIILYMTLCKEVKMKNYLPLAFILMVSGSCVSFAQEAGDEVSILNEEGLAALDAKADTDVTACEAKVNDLIAAYIKDTGDSQKVIGERIGQLKDAMAANPDAFKDDQAFIQELEKNLAKSDRAEGYGEFANYEEYKTDKMKKEGRTGEGLAACQSNNATLLVKYNEHANEIKQRAEKINTLVDKINGMDQG